MAYSTAYTPACKKKLSKLPDKAARELCSAFESFGADPQNFQGDLRKIKAQKAVWRIRWGDYRILFIKSKSAITAYAADDRKDVY